MPGEQTLPHPGWLDVPANRGRRDEPSEAILNRILTRRFHVDGVETPEPEDTTVEEAFAGKLTLAGLLSGDRLHVHGWAKVPSQNGTNELTPRVRLGGLAGVVIATVAAWDPADGDRVKWDAWIHFETIAAAAASSFHSWGEAKRTGGSVEDTVVENNATLDLTGEVDVVLTQQWSADHASNRLACYDFAAELYRSRQT